MASKAASGGGSGTALAMLAITSGSVLIYSSLKGIGFTDVFAGIAGDALNPHGGSTAAVAGKVDPASASNAGDTSGALGGLVTGGKWTAPAGGAHGFKGPKAALLNELAGVAQSHFKLSITATTNGNHVSNSDHYVGRAFDCSGGEPDMKAFSEYVVSNYKSQIKQLIHNPGFSYDHGIKVPSAFYAAVWAGHRDHVHLAM